MEVSVVSAVYFAADKSPYLELHYSISGTTLSYSSLSSSQSSVVKVLMTLESNGEITSFDHYRLNTELETSKEDIIDIRRYNLPAGKYLLNIEVTDLNDSTSIYIHKDSIFISELKSSPEIGSILLVSNIDAKSGDESNTDARVKYNFMLTALPHQYAYRNVHKLYYYTELYNMPLEENEGYYYIKTELKEAKLGQKTGAALYENKRKRKAKDLDVFINALDLEEIPSGNYYLLLSAETEDGEKIAESYLLFQRSNPEFDRKLLLTAIPEAKDEGDLKKFESIPNDTLVYSLKAISPLVRQVDSELIKILVNERDSKAMSRYLSNYFNDEYPAAPYSAYQQFMVIARFTDQYYNNGFRHGFETDRGRIFIKYGRPSDIVTVEDEVSAPPYEIWVYNEMIQNNQTNVKFLFYNPDLMHNGHILLHSTARGEINNAQWQTILYKNAPGEGQKQSNFFEGQNAQEAINRRAVRYFNDL